MSGASVSETAAGADQPDVAAPGGASQPEAMPRGWRGIWDARRARLWLLAAIVAAWLPLVGMPLRNWLDFSAFYAAGALAFTPAVTSLEAIVRFQDLHQLPITPWVYPAGLALLYVPFLVAALRAGRRAPRRRSRPGCWRWPPGSGHPCWASLGAGRSLARSPGHRPQPVS